VSCWTWATGSAPGGSCGGCSTGPPPELLAELAGLATDLGWARRTSVPRRCAAPSGGCRHAGGLRPFPASGLAGLAARAAPGRRTRGPGGATRRGRDGGGEVSSYLATRGGVDDAAEQGGRPDGYPVDYDRAALERPQAAVCTGCHLERTPADVARGDGVCADCRADGLGRHPMVVRSEAILAAAVRRGPWARRELRPLWNAADAADRATITAWVAAHDARIPRPRATADPHLPSPRPGHLTVTGPLRVAVGRWRRSAWPTCARRAHAS
jgi:hypothetical protein